MDYAEALGKLLEATKPRYDGDTVDRFNYCFTTGVLIICSLFVALWEFVGTPIACWVPAYFNDFWEEYATDYCFVQNTYFLPITQGSRDNHQETISARVQIPQNITERERYLIPYYQWVPVILGLSGACFFLPVVIWRSLNSQYGLQVNTILTIASNADHATNKEEREKDMHTVGRFLSRGLSVEMETAPNRLVYRYRRCHIALLYLMVKILYSINSIIQFMFLGALLDYRWDYGARVLTDIAAGKEWPISGHFPRVTMCDFEVRVLGNLHRHTVQCVLMINMFNEKIFVFAWWWFLILMLTNAISFIKWLYYVAWSKHRYRFIKELEPEIGRHEDILTEFVDHFVHIDGVFLLKLIELNAGPVPSKELLQHIWDEYKASKDNYLHPGNSLSTSEYYVPTPHRGESPFSSAPLLDVGDLML